MAEFLVRGVTNGTTAGKWRRGDIVSVQADGWNWGSKEVAPDFYKIKVPGMSVAKARLLLGRWNDSVNLGDRCLWRVVVTDIPLAIRNVLLSTGQLTIGVDCTRAQAQAVLRRKDTEATADLT